MTQQTIRIGTMVNAPDMAGYIGQILPHGFESFSLSWWENTGPTGLPGVAKQVRQVLAGSQAVVSSLSVFGNPLGADDKAQAARDSWEKLIDAAKTFGCDLAAGPKMEAAARKLFGSKFALTVSSGTGALHAAFVAAGVGPGK